MLRQERQISPGCGAAAAPIQDDPEPQRAAAEESGC